MRAWRSSFRLSDGARQREAEAGARRPRLRSAVVLERKKRRKPELAEDQSESVERKGALRLGLIRSLLSQV